MRFASLLSMFSSSLDFSKRFTLSYWNNPKNRINQYAIFNITLIKANLFICPGSASLAFVAQALPTKRSISMPPASSTPKFNKRVHHQSPSLRSRAGLARTHLRGPSKPPSWPLAHILKLFIVFRPHRTMGRQAFPAIRRVRSAVDHKVRVLLRLV